MAARLENGRTGRNAYPLAIGLAADSRLRMLAHLDRSGIHREEMPMTILSSKQSLNTSRVVQAIYIPDGSLVVSAADFDLMSEWGREIERLTRELEQRPVYLEGLSIQQWKERAKKGWEMYERRAAETPAPASKELLNCPFCGCESWMHADGTAFNDGRIGYRVECEGTCHAMTCYWHERADAVKHWNQRQPSETSACRNMVTLNGYQLKEALEFIAPDGEAEQLEADVTIEWGDDGHAGKGYYASITEYPDEGSILLDGKPESPEKTSERECRRCSVPLPPQEVWASEPCGVCIPPAPEKARAPLKCKCGKDLVPYAGCPACDVPAEKTNEPPQFPRDTPPGLQNHKAATADVGMFGSGALKASGLHQGDVDATKRDYPARVGKPALCEDCPPIGYVTDKIRCAPCPRRASIAQNGE